MPIKKNTLINNIVFLVLVFLAFTDVFIADIGGIRISAYILFGFLGILSISLFRNPSLKVLDAKVIPLLVFIILTTLINYKYAKYTSVIYSVLFIMYFMFYKVLIKHEGMDKILFVKIFKTILLSYFIVLLASQMLVLSGFVSLEEKVKGYYILSGPVGILFETTTNAFRYSSLSSEPSYSAIIVLTAYYMLYNLISKQKERLHFGLITFYMVLSFKSAFGIILLGIFFLFGMKLRKKWVLSIFAAAILCIISLTFIETGVNSIERVKAVVATLFSNQSGFLEDLKMVDGSAFFRLSPFVYYLSEMDLLDFHTYIGYGANASQDFFSRLMLPNDPTAVFTPSMMPGFLYDYGIVGIFLVIWSLFHVYIKKNNLFEIILIAAVIINSNFNTQLFWFVITCLFIKNNCFESKKEQQLFGNEKLATISNN